MTEAFPTAFHPYFLFSTEVAYEKSKIKALFTKGAAKVPIVIQMEALECGAVSLAMVFLISGSEKVVGIFAGFWCGWFLERRFVKFEIHGSILRRVVIFICGIAVLFALYKFLLPFIFSSLSQSASK